MGNFPFKYDNSYMFIIKKIIITTMHDFKKKVMGFIF